MSSLAKDSSRSRISGGVFEYQLAGLAVTRLRVLRRQRRDLHFQLATNVDGANPFDDIVLNLRWLEDGHTRALTYFVQLKHKENVNIPVNTNDLVGKVTQRNKDFNLHHYFEKLLEAQEKISFVPDERKTPTQKKLQQWFKEDFRLILLTTREVLPLKRHSRHSPSLDFPFEDVFGTSQGEKFSFGESDTEVWNMLQHSPQEHSFRENFLARLRIHSGQAMAYALRPLLAAAFADALVTPFPSRIENLLTQYCSFLHRWWECDDGQCLTDLTHEIQRIIRDDIHNQLPSPLRFQEQICNSLKERLMDYTVAYIIVPGIPPNIRCSKLRSILNESDNFVILTESTFREHSFQVLRELCFSVCKQIILCVDNVKADVISLVKEILAENKHKVRVLSGEWDDGLYSVLRRETTSCSTWSENWALDQLHVDEQRKLLSRGVSFQGQHVEWQELVCACPSLQTHLAGATLGALTRSQPLVLGSPLPELNSLYVPRVVQHRTILSRHLFELVSSRDRFVLKRFPQNILQKLRAYDSKWQECLSSGAIIQKSPPNKVRKTFKRADKKSQSGYTRWSEWNAEIPAQPMHAKENLHWLTIENNAIVWEESQGDAQVLIEYIKRKNNKCKNTALCSHEDIEEFLDWSDSVVFLTDVAGMGKSTFFANAARVFKAARKSHWVVLLRISEGRMIDSIPDEVMSSHALALLQRATGTHLFPSADTADKFLKDAFLKSGQIIIMIDGVDEVCPAHKIKVLHLLSVLKETLITSGGQLWVAARTVLQEDIGRTLRYCTPLKLRPFSNYEQQLYLVQRWRENMGNMTVEELERVVRELISTVRMASGRGISSLCDVPLYTRLLAETYEGTDLKLLFHGRAAVLRTIMNRATLYKKFVFKTLGAVWEKAGLSEGDRINLNIPSDESILENHKMYAALQCFNDSRLLGKYYNQLVKEVNAMNNEQLQEKTVKMGLIINVVQGIPIFLHHTIEEFLAALWLVDKYTYLPTLTKALYESQFTEVRYFFDALLAEGHILHEAALSGLPGAMSLTLRSMRSDDFSDSASFNLDDVDKGGRRAIHLAAIYGNVAETRLLLARGAKLDPPDDVHRWSPLKYADVMTRFSCGETWTPDDTFVSTHLGVVENLLRNGAKARDAQHVLKIKHLVHFALVSDYEHILKRVMYERSFLCGMKVLKDIPYLHMASNFRSIGIISMLIDMGFNVNKASPPTEETPLHIGAKKGFTDVCELLLNAGAKVNAVDSYGRTPLHAAAQSGCLTVLELFLSHGANLDVRDSFNNQPLATWATAGQKSGCYLLLAAGASPIGTNDLKNTPVRPEASEGIEGKGLRLFEEGLDVNAISSMG